MILRIRNSKDSTRKILDLVNTFNKVAGWKTNVQKYITFSIFQ